MAQNAINGFGITANHREIDLLPKRQSTSGTRFLKHSHT
ncbi:hypothetical protein VCHC42A1_1521, partial [Vibrio cholerae HC-42A1]